MSISFLIKLALLYTSSSSLISVNSRASSLVLSTSVIEVPLSTFLTFLEVPLPITTPAKIPIAAHKAAIVINFFLLVGLA